MKRRIISNLVTTICTAVVTTTILSGCDSAQLNLNKDTEEKIEEDVRALVEAKTGITDFELSKTGYTYIEEYDVLFDQVSDTNYVKAICEKGVRNGELIQVSVYGETDRIGRVGSYRRITLIETGDSKNPYHFYSNRELWEKYVDDTIEASDYETDEKIICAYISGEFGPEIVVIDDNAVSRIVYLRLKDHDMTNFDDYKEIVFYDVNGDEYKDMIIIASDDKETIAVVCSSYEDRSGNICLDGGDDSVTNWLGENVDNMTADNVISYILDHKDEYEDL